MHYLLGTVDPQTINTVERALQRMHILRKDAEIKPQSTAVFREMFELISILCERGYAQNVIQLFQEEIDRKQENSMTFYFLATSYFLEKSSAQRTVVFEPTEAKTLNRGILLLFYLFFFFFFSYCVLCY
jgi:hypothetical protein